MGTFIQVPIVVATYDNTWTSGLLAYPNYRVAVGISSNFSGTASLAVAFRLASGEYPLRMFVISDSNTGLSSLSAESQTRGQTESFSIFTTNVFILGQSYQIGSRQFPHTTNDYTVDYPEPFETVQAAYEQLSNSVAPEGFRNIRYNTTGAIVTGSSYLKVGDTATVIVSPNIGSTVTANNIEVIQAGNKIPFTYSNNKITFTVP